MRRNRNAKIVATLGPASTSRETIEALFKAGADVFRLNFSHGTHEDHQRRLELIRVDREGRGPADRRAARSAGSETADRHVREWPDQA